MTHKLSQVAIIAFKRTLRLVFFCWERESHVCSLLTPIQLYKNGPWVWNTFY